MTTAIQPQDMADMVVGQLNKLNRGKFVFDGTDLREFPVMNRLLKQDKTVQAGGTGYQHTLMLTHQNAARHASPLELDQRGIFNVLQKMSFDWVHADTHWEVLRQELLMNKGAEKIVDIIDARRLGARVDLAEQLEEKWWGDAPTVAEATIHPLNAKYWFPSNATEGFNGGLAEDHTTTAGINITTYTRYKSYTGTWSAYTDSDFLALVRRTLRKIKFITPMSAKEMRKFGDTYRGYTTEANINEFERLAEKRNDNLGKNLIMYFGAVMLNKCTIQEVPYLTDNDSNNPLFMLNHDTLFPVVLEGDYFAETVTPVAGQHNVTQTFVDLTYNFGCISRRRNAHLYKV